MTELAELKEIRPVPLEDIVLEESGELPGSVSSSHQSNSPWLKSTLHGLIRVQKYSAYGFATFVGIHLTSVVIVPVIPLLPSETKQEIFEMARAVYLSIPQVENILILGSSLLHVASGIGIRIIRSILYNQRHSKEHRKNKQEFIITDDYRDDIGLGGITNMLGLGYRKSWVSKYLGLSPLTVAGYCLVPLLLVHYLKFRYIPCSVEGDSSLINLDYISYYLKVSPQGKIGDFINFWGLASMVWIGTYHMVNGWLKLTHRYSKNWKRIGWGVVNSMGILGFISLALYKRLPLEPSGFMGKSFVKYLNAFYF
ncbi:uncharacterized protein RJT20DRAFT_136585 [Scheffersomyces xylosifermentans]|uniref:uncharacterized protein n=1 Tax=Scheffersomyces xylosifermentans TaxID=1304137 RepID=UPI00315DB796